MLTEDQTPSLRDRVTAQISERIIDGELRAGERIHERHLSEELGVSRVPVREAILTLAAQGLVTVKPRSGAFVRKLTRRDVAELFDVREALEPAIASAAARARSEDDLAQLRSAIDIASDAAVCFDAGTGSRSNADFHAALAQASHHRLLQSMMDPLSLTIRRLFRTTIVGHDADLLRDHAEQLAAIEEQDIEWAGILARRHVIRTRERSLAMFPDDDAIDAS
ncbi:MAG TPA: GntR family transcriptional regulator [Microlunatus sp.]